MQVKTILNRIQKHSGFVYEDVSLAKQAEDIEVRVRPRANSRPICSCCGRLGPGYDTLKPRRFEYVPLWGFKVFFVYPMRRVACARCGIRVETIPWAEGKHRLTQTYAWVLANWAKRTSWKDVAEAFQTSWENVFRSVQRAVEWGRQHRKPDCIKAIGIDELQWQRGQQYLTMVYQIDKHRKRLLWVGRDRKVKTLLRFFQWFGRARSSAVRFSCSDMWRPYLRVVTKKASRAIHVLDRFHIMAQMSKAIDEVRAKEARELKANGHEPVLKGSRWLLLKRSDNLTTYQSGRLAELLRYNLKTVRSYLLKEDFQLLWDCPSAYHAGRFLDRWCTRTMRSRIEPMMKVAKTFRRHRPLILNWFSAKGLISTAAVEGFNNKAKLTTRKAFGYRTFEAMEVALYHTLGDLPQPPLTHRFC